MLARSKRNNKPTSTYRTEDCKSLCLELSNRLIMPQRSRSYRKRQQDGDEDEVEDVSESGGKEDQDSEEDSVRFVLVLAQMD